MIIFYIISGTSDYDCRRAFYKICFVFGYCDLIQASPIHPYALA